MNNADPAVNTLNDGQSITDTFTYRLTDSDGTTRDASLSITINGHTDATPTISIPDTDGGSATSDTTLPETAGATAGSFTIAAQAGIGAIDVNTTHLTLAQLNALGTSPVTVTTPDGTLVLTGFNSASGTVSYTYDPNVLTHTSSAPIVDHLSIKLIDANGVQSSDSLDITITDSLPAAANDTAGIVEDAVPNTVTGSVLTNDTVGADINANPVSLVSPAAGAHGTLTLNANGTYSYALNNADPAVNSLSSGQTLTDTFTYRLTDGDGSSTTATLTLTITGSNDAAIITPGHSGRRPRHGQGRYEPHHRRTAQRH